MTAVEAVGLGVAYAGRAVLIDVSFSLYEGSVTALLGGNGVGKSSLINRMLDLTPGTGRCVFWGEPMRRLRNASATVGAVVDGNPLIHTWSPEQHLDSVRRMTGVPRARAQEVIRQVGLEAVQHRRASVLSLGQRQRLGLAMALVTRPRVLVLDEPTTGLDTQGIEWLFAQLRTLADDGCTIFASSHQIGEATAVADRALLLSRGRITWDGTIDALRAEGGASVVRLTTPDGDRAVSVLEAAGIRVQQRRGDTVWLHGCSMTEIGRLGFAAQIEIHELSVEGNAATSGFKSLLDEGAEVAS